MSPPVILLHGCGGSSRSTFEATGCLDALAAAGRTWVVVDLPGHGKREVSHDPASYADLAGLIERDLPPGVLDAIGFSLGSKLLLELAIRNPKRFGRMVLGGVGDNVFAPERIAEAAASALEKGVTAETPPPVVAFMQTWEPDQNDALAIAAVLRRPPNPVFTLDRFKAVTAPVLIINGAEDAVTHLGNRLLESLPEVRSVILPGADHFGLTRHPAFIRQAIEFLAQEPA